MTLAALGVQAALLHVITNDILGYVELINQSSSDQLFQIVAYSVSKKSVVSKRSSWSSSCSLGGGGGGYEVTCMLKLYFVFFDEHQIANEVITPYWISQNDTTVVMEAVTDGSGTIYIMRVDFEGSGILIIIFYYYLPLSFLHPLLLFIFDVMQKESPTKVR